MSFRRLLPILILITVGFAAAPFLKPPSVKEAQPLTGLPWQIETHPDGSSSVFGINLGHHRFTDAQTLFGLDRELAIIQTEQDPPSLEMFYSRYTAGVLQGKLLLVGELESTLAQAMMVRSGIPKILASGARKYHLQADDIAIAEHALIASITFLPTANLDAEVTRKRFGVESELLHGEAGSLHLLYPQQGLDVILNAQHRDVLQYVAPRNFPLLREPLLPGTE